MTNIFEPLTAGNLRLSNRIVMAPLTRARAGARRIPNELMARYYAQRAGAGLILSEAVAVTPKGVGYENTPGLWSQAQVDGWKVVTDAVHAKGGQIVAQLWHVGRISDPSLLDGDLPVAPSAIAPQGHVSLLRPIRPYVTPRALDLSEIPLIVEAYRLGARNAQKAGFDGVELHGANGYLLDQFLESGSNRRTDLYGGSVENRARLLLESVDACISVWGPGGVGVHISPNGTSHDIHDDDPATTFGYMASELGRRGIAFLFVREPEGPDALRPRLKRAFGGVVIANQGLDASSAQAALDEGSADAAAFGVGFIANPDLPERIRKGAAWNPPNQATFYGDGPEGYTDYPALG
jgi:2,4-dienoyl-CoA reductase-like NADH-dependent reductase (Old Yellow Enzyme family)